MAYRLLRPNNWLIVNNKKKNSKYSTHLRFSLGLGLPLVTVSATISSLLLTIFDTFVIAYAFNGKLSLINTPSTY